MNANKMWCKSIFSFLMQMLSDRDAIAIFMMQMSHTGVQMQSLSMMVLMHIFKPWCKCLLAEVKMQNLTVQMPPSGYVVMRMSPWGYAMMQMPLCKVCHDANALMQIQFIRKFFLFLNRRLLSAWNQNTFPFQNTIYFSQKVIFLYLRFLKIGDHC